jgi:hypothetical protein
MAQDVLVEVERRVGRGSGCVAAVGAEPRIVIDLWNTRSQSSPFRADLGGFRKLPDAVLAQIGKFVLRELPKREENDSGNYSRCTP